MPSDCSIALFDLVASSPWSCGVTRRIRAVGEVATGGGATLRLAGIDRPARVYVDGKRVDGAWRDGVVTVRVKKGDHRIVLRPVGGS